MTREAIAGSLAAETGERLTRLLLEAPPDVLDAALDNEALEESQLLLVLRRPDVGPELLHRVGAVPRWASRYLVKAALAAHPRTPRTLSMALVKHLFWRDLVKLAVDPRLESAVRRAAEVALRDRVHELSLGERKTLARMAPREVIKALRAEPDARVVGTLLLNPRFTEEDLLVMANGRRTAAGVLTAIARSERWIARPAVRLALVRNPGTPVPVAISLLVSLDQRLLRDVAGRRDTPQPIRLAARRLVARREARAPGP